MQETLGENFTGVYLQGLLAVGDFDVHSDVDWIAVVEEALSAGEQRPVLAALFPPYCPDQSISASLLALGCCGHMIHFWLGRFLACLDVFHLAIVPGLQCLL